MSKKSNQIPNLNIDTQPLFLKYTMDQIMDVESGRTQYRDIKVM
jgi:hypothetical protein